MRWEKLGRIFRSRSKTHWLHTHSAVPLADRIEGSLYKVYFSGRDNLGRSSTGYIVIDIQKPKSVINIASQPVLQPGSFAMFDDAGAMGSWIVNQESEKYFYYIGWNLGHKVPFRNAIGLAISHDNGNTFVKYSKGPIVDRGIHDPCFVASSCVIREGGIWRMWYLSCLKWLQASPQPKHYYHIKYAESSDGINWERKGVVCIDFAYPGEYAISRPCVVKDGDTYKMWYSYRGQAYRIGYAESADGLTWHRRDHDAGIDVSPSGWDADMICYPFVFDHGGSRYMLYNGNGYGKSGFGLAILEQD